tara:strand:+ start:1462 stop:4296 length:2835 start_codon:yes stop_codon:yes gene_type:complete
MPLLTTSVPNLVQGVSQQPDNLRFPGQAESQVNAISSVVEGLTKRPSTEHVKDLFSTPIQNDALIHFVDRDDTNKHVMCFNNDSGTTSVSIFNLSLGTSIPVTSISSSAQAYLNGATDPINDLRALTVADYTFVSNKKTTVSLGTELSEPLAKEALIFVKQGAQGKDYNAKINGVESTVNSSSSDSGDIADDLATAINTSFPSSGSYLQSITVASGGSGYTLAEIAVDEASNYNDYKVEIEFKQAGGGSGAKGTAIISNGVITGVTLTSVGTGYIAGTAIQPVFTEWGYGKAPYGKWSGWINISDNYYWRRLYDPNFNTGGPVDYRASQGEAGAVNATFSVSSSDTTTGGTITATREGSLVKITNAVTSDFSVTTTDGLSNTGLQSIYKEVDFITDLPKACFNGFRVKVRGDAELNQDDYFVVFETKDNEDFGEGAWIETYGWAEDRSAGGQGDGEKVGFNDASLPIRIVPNPLNAAGEITGYTIKTTPWDNREAGNLKTNPAPSFVGSKINDIFFFKNRLGLLTDTSVVFSEADSYFNFWRTTTQSLLDSAPIDVGVAHTKVSTLKHAIPFQEKLLLFGPQSQFVLRGNQILTPKTVNISPVTEYNANTKIRPLALSNFVYFSFPRGTSEGVYEFYVDNDTDVFDASEVTAQVPTYIKGSLRSLVGTSTEDLVIASSNNNLKQLYIYRYYWNNKEKIQSAWQRFDFANDVLGVSFMDSTLYLITNDGTKTNLERMFVAPAHVDGTKNYSILLDRRVSSSVLGKSYSTSTKLTTVTGMPYDPVNAVVYTLEGVRLPITRVSSSSFTVNVDISSADFFVGLEYDMEYEFSLQTLKQPTEKGGRSTSNFTSQMLKNGSVEYSDTGHFTVEVTPKYRDTYSYAFNPSILGADSVVGSLVLDDGSFRFPIHSKHDEATIKIKSSSALPAHLLSAEFESFIHARSRRYS